MTRVIGLNSKQTPFGTLSYTYNEAGSLATLRSSNANGVSVDYSYDALNRLDTVKDNNLVALNGGVTNYTLRLRRQFARLLVSERGQFELRLQLT